MSKLSKRIKISAGIVVLGSALATCLYDMNFDHTKGECAITKVLNMIPIEEDNLPLGLALHQDLAIMSDLKEQGYEKVAVYHGRDFETEYVDIKADGESINNIQVVLRKKNRR